MLVSEVYMCKLYESRIRKLLKLGTFNHFSVSNVMFRGIYNIVTLFFREKQVAVESLEQFTIPD